MEQRKHPRFAVRFPVWFGEEDLRSEGKAWNLSTGGCAVETNMSLPIGTYVKMHLSFPDELTPLAIQVAAVRWSNLQGFGVEFIGISMDEQKRLQRLVSNLRQPA